MSFFLAYKDIATPVYKATASNGLKAMYENNVQISSAANVGATSEVSIEGASITTEGTTSRTYYCTDNEALSCAVATTTVNVDGSAPYDVTVEKPAGQQPTNSGVSLSLKGTDAYSGVTKFILYKATNVTEAELATIDLTNDDVLSDLQWNEVTTVAMSSAQKNAASTYKVTENGLYMVKAVDVVGYETTSMDSATTPGGGIVIVDEIDPHKPITKKEFTGSSNSYGIATPYHNDTNGYDWYGPASELKISAQDPNKDDNGDFIMSKGLKQLVVNGTNYETPAEGGVWAEKKVYKYQTGLNTWEFYAEDNEGNVSDTDTFSAYIDDVKPTECTLTADETLTASPETGIPVTLSAKDNESGLYQLNLMYAATSTEEFTVYESYSCGGALEQVTHEFAARANGFYMLQAVDCVGNVYNDEDGVKYINGLDGTAPGVTISPDTTEWVNEATGVDLTAVAKDEESGVDEVTIEQKDEETGAFSVIDTTTFEMLKDENTGEYLTHINGDFIAGAVDGAGNKFRMEEKNALNVPNIDPDKPTIQTTVDLSTKGNASGVPLTFYTQDKASGLGDITLQKLDANGNWADTGATYAIENYKSGEEKEITAKGINRIAVKAGNLVSGILGNGTTGYKGDSTNLKGSTDMLKATYTVTESGTYRIAVGDVVLNRNGSESLAVIVDSTLPTILVEGNPTEWTNQTATLKVSATDADGAITAMTLDGASQKMSESSGVYSFTFDVPENNSFVVTATDEAGNVATQTIDVTKIDKVAPSIDASIGAFSKGTAQAQVNLTDDLSGINTAYFNNLSIDITNEKSTSYTHDVTAGSDYEVTLTDKAGNKAVKQLSKESVFEYIKITTPPDKTEYIVGDDFDKTGMIVTAYYTDGTEKVVTDYTIENGTNLTKDVTDIKVSYTEDGITSTDTTPITVTDGITKEETKLPTVGTPKTGDDTNILVYVVILLILLASGVGVYLYKRKKKSHSDTE